MRVFVAAELPDEVAARLVGWTPPDPALRPVARAALHLTLAFLGERPDEEAERVAGLLGGLARPVGGLRLGAPRWLPPRRPGVLAVEVVDPDGALRALQAELVAALEEAIGFQGERRAYLPHVTVARVRGAGGTRGRRPAGPPPRLPDVGAGPGRGEPFAATAITLLRSRLSPHGARYEALRRVGL